VLRRVEPPAVRKTGEAPLPIPRERTVQPRA
jgi:hypothetical protein